MSATCRAKGAQILNELDAVGTPTRRSRRHRDRPAVLAATALFGS